MGAIFILIGAVGGVVLFAWGALGVVSPRAAKLESRGEAIARIAMAIFVVFAWTSLGRWIDSGLQSEVDSASSADVATNQTKDKSEASRNVDDDQNRITQEIDITFKDDIEKDTTIAKIEEAIESGNAHNARKLITQAKTSGVLSEEAYVSFRSKVADLHVLSVIENYKSTRDRDSLLAIKSLRDEFREYGKDLPFASVEVKDQLESIVRALPASRFEENEIGYQALLFFDQNNKFYLVKVRNYREKLAAARRAELKQKIAHATRNLTQKYDKIQDVTWYKHKRQPRYADTRSYILPYVGRKGNSAWLRVRINYAADKWLFVKDVVLYVDGETYNLFLPGFERDHDTEIWEWVDVEGDSLRKNLELITQSKEAILRFRGDQYYRDVTIPDADKKAISDVLSAYDFMKSGQF